MSPNLILHPRIAPAGTAYVWVGAFERTQAPALGWTLDGAPVHPTVLRAMASARPDDLLRDPGTPRAFTGLFSVALGDDRAHRLTVSTGGERTELVVRSLPAELPSEASDRFPEAWFNVLLVSCFHWDTDHGGSAGQVVAALGGDMRPHATFLLGDQVYLDLPTLQDLPSDESVLAAKFEDDYVRNWRSQTAMGSIFAVAPSATIPDDHEFWNNFPHGSAFIQNSWSAEGKRRWTRAAMTLYEAFQLAPPATLGLPFVFDLPPLSFCLADTRTARQEDLSATLSAAALNALRTWAQQAAVNKRVPIFASGQPVLAAKAGEFEGKIGDYGLANYRDFGQLAGVLGSVASWERRLVMLTGDVHWGRFTEVSDPTHLPVACEVITSPASLVRFIGADEVFNAWGTIKSWFGDRDPWPRHAEAAQPPPTIGLGAAQPHTCVAQHGQKGNQVALLSFRRRGFGVDLRTTFIPLNSDSGSGADMRPVVLPTVALS